MGNALPALGSFILALLRILHPLLTIEGDAVLTQLVNKEAEREQEAHIKKPKYTTIDGIPVIGRDQDRENVINILRDKDIHLLVLVGLPGVGKSELARQVRIEAERQGLFTYVRPLDLAREVRNPEAVITLLNGMLKGIPKQVRTLVILHNCEQVKGLTQALNRFLDEHKHVTILATSRKQMTRNDYPVKPLNAPKKDAFLESLQNCDSVKLFLAGANSNAPVNGPVLKLTWETAKTIVPICIRLGGLPILLLMVASWVEELTLDGIFNKLKDRTILTEKYSDEYIVIGDHKRHQTIQNLIAWSYDLLDEPTRKLFRRLGVFAGRCSLRAIKDICTLDDLSKEDHEITGILRQLKNHLLITYNNQEVQISHSIIRDFALYMLQEKGEYEKITREFADYFYILVIDYQIVNCYGEFDKFMIQSYDYISAMVTEYIKVVHGEGTDKSLTIGKYRERFFQEFNYYNFYAAKEIIDQIRLIYLENNPEMIVWVKYNGEDYLKIFYEPRHSMYIGRIALRRGKSTFLYTEKEGVPYRLYETYASKEDPYVPARRYDNFTPSNWIDP